MASSQRIRRIKVTKLFGIFDHDIPLNMKDRITILHGPNGFGKTKILLMLENLLGGDWEPLALVPFEEFSVEFDDGSVLAVTQRREARTGQLDDQVFSLRCADGVESSVFSWEHDDVGAWLMEICPDINPYVIGTQRLTGRVYSAKTKKTKTELAVTTCANGIKRKIQSTLTKYAEHAQKLDSTFLDRLFQVRSEAAPSMAELQERLETLNEKRARLIRLGVLDPERDSHKGTPRLEASKRDVLTIYIQDTESKLAVLESLARRIELFTEAINRRFTYKRMSISRETGVVFHSLGNDAEISLDSLSSGEQHELILLYKLIFTKIDGIVLIDEPEISMHLAWQNEFLDDLTKIVALGDYDVLLATHSPAIINDRWDLTVELKGPELSKAAE